MNKFFRKITILTLAVLLIGNTAFAKNNPVISFGKDLNDQERQQMMTIFKADPSAEIIETSNEEERKYLGAYVDSKVLGTRAISSSYVEPLRQGKGIIVETYNISWVTEDMLISALVTAGVKDARVTVAAPFSVSGTAALTGVIKGFEGATGQWIDEESKYVASEEIATTGELGEAIGSEEASTIINKVKEEVVERGLDDPEEIRRVIENVSNEVSINLTEEQKEQITQLMEKISNLDLNVEEIKSQLKNISQKLKDLSENEEVKSVLNKILDVLKSIFQKLGQLINK